MCTERSMPTCACERVLFTQGSCVGWKVRVWKAVLRNPTHSAGRWEPTIVREQKRNTEGAACWGRGCGQSCNDGVVRAAQM